MNITLVHSGALGDTVLLAPLLRSLKQRWPGAQRTVVMRPSFGRMLVDLAVAEAAADGDDSLHSRWFAAGNWGLDAALPWAGCDLLISAVSSGDDPWADHARRLARAGEILFFNPLPPADFPGHVTEFQRGQLMELALPIPPLPPVRHNVNGAVLIHPGAGSRAKCRPPAQFVLLGQRLLRAKKPVEFVLGEAELQRWDESQIDMLGNEFCIHKMPALPDLTRMLRAAAAYIGHDSGPTHLAAALGLPTVAAFTVTDPRRWRPVGPRVVTADEAASVDQIAALVLKMLKE